MGKLQVRVSLLVLLILQQCLAMPVSSHCVGDSLCTFSLKHYYSQMITLPGDINTRSIATWSYHENTDLNREPRVIYEAKCHDSTSSGSCSAALGLETIPITLRIPVLRKNLACFPLSSYSVEFEKITVACICALPRIKDEIAQGSSLDI